MKLLSISMPHHDANMSYFDGKCVRYHKLERTRHEKRFSFEALEEWKRDAEAIWQIDALEIDDVVFTFDPRALPQHLHQYFHPEMLYRLASGRSLAETLDARICAFLGVRRGWFISHHYSHALSTWMLESEPPDAHIVIDGLGDGRPWSVYRGERLVAGGHIKNGSLGWGIREAGKLLGIQYGHYNDIAGKVMGLQSYGRVDAEFSEHLDKLEFTQIKDIWSVEHWYAYKGDSHVGKLTLLDWVTTVHSKMGQMIVDFAGRFAGPDDTIAYSGGVAQNVIWNSQLRKHFPKLLIPPHASDEGLSLGGIEWLRRRHGIASLKLPDFPYAQSDVGASLPSDQTIDMAAQLLAQGKILGWYQGNGEIGPRALGNRSILMDPRIKNGKISMNRVKKRENYRPFGASVLQAHYPDYFDGEADAFMLYSCRVKKAEEFPAITHIDLTCRVQLVDATNAVFNKLLTKFFELTGCPLLTNTSLNLAGKPIAGHPDEARQLFIDSPIDAMVIGNEVLRK